MDRGCSNVQCCNHFGPRARLTIALRLNALIVVLSASKIASCRGGSQGMLLCDDIVDELHSQSVISCTQRATQYSSPTPRIDRNCWALCWRQAGTWLWFQGACAFATQMLDLARPWSTCDDFEVQVIAAAAMLYMWTKLHGTYLERVGPQVRLALRTEPCFSSSAQRSTTKRCSRKMFFAKSTAS